MKRFTAIFMLFCYLLFNAGISYSMHFCGEELTSTELFSSKKGCACSGESKTSHDCCNDFHVESGSEEQNSPAFLKIKFEKSFAEKFNFHWSELEKSFYPAFNSFSFSYQSPPLYKVPKFIFNQIFRL